MRVPQPGECGAGHISAIGGWDDIPAQVWCIHNVYVQSFQIIIHKVRFRSIAAYAHTQQNTQILLLWGSCPPAVWRKVGLHKGFDAHKAPDTPPGRVDDIVGVFQIVPALVGDQGIAESTGLDRLPQKTSCVNANLSGQGPSILLRKTVLLLKSPTGAFIAPLRFANANLSGQGPSICCRRPFCCLKAPLGLSLLRCASQTRTFENTSLSAGCKKTRGKL